MSTTNIGKPGLALVFARSLPAVLAVAVILASPYAGCSTKKIQEMVSGKSADAGKGGAVSTTRVKVASPTVETIHRYLRYTGTAQPARQVRIVPDVTAKLSKLPVKNGDRVKKGQLLAKLDTKLYGLQKQQASAMVKLAQTQVGSVEKEWNRMAPLAESGAVSQQQVDQTKAGLDAASAQLDQAKAALALASYSVKQSTVKAPFDGIITNVLVNEGEFVGPQLAAYGMFTLVDLSDMKIVISITDKDLAAVHQGLGVEITSDALPDRVLTGEVAVVTPSADPLSKSFPVEVHLSNADEAVKAGMYVRVAIHVETVEGALTLPKSALLERKDGWVVYVVGKDGKVSIREVTPGVESDDRVQVTGSDLTIDDRVVVEGNFGLKDGSAVVVIE